MNNKMAINTFIYQHLNIKNKLSKLEEQRQNHGYGEHIDGCQISGQCGGMGEELRGLRSTNRQLQNSRRGVTYNRVWSSQRSYARDPGTSTMVWGLPEGVGGALWRGAKGEKLGQL